jgi:hypothetical protein
LKATLEGGFLCRIYISKACHECLLEEGISHLHHWWSCLPVPSFLEVRRWRFRSDVLSHTTSFFFSFELDL